MRGRKIDSNFVIEYLQACISNGITNMSEIENYLNMEMQQIDKKIIEAEELKKKRSKLMDVKIYLKK